MTKFKNHAAGPRGIHGEKGFVMLEPGQEVDIDVSPAEASSAKKTGWFQPNGEPEPDVKADSKK